MVFDKGVLKRNDVFFQRVFTREFLNGFWEYGGFPYGVYLYGAFKIYIGEYIFCDVLWWFERGVLAWWVLKYIWRNIFSMESFEYV